MDGFHHNTRSLYIFFEIDILLKLVVDESIHWNIYFPANLIIGSNGICQNNTIITCNRNAFKKLTVYPPAIMIFRVHFSFVWSLCENPFWYRSTNFRMMDLNWPANRLLCSTTIPYRSWNIEVTKSTFSPIISLY